MKVHIGTSWQDESGRWNRVDVDVDDEDLALSKKERTELYKALVAEATMYAVHATATARGMSPEEAQRRVGLFLPVAT